MVSFCISNNNFKPESSVTLPSLIHLTSCSCWKITILPPRSPVAKSSPEWLNSTAEMMSAATHTIMIYWKEQLWEHIVSPKVSEKISDCLCLRACGRKHAEPGIKSISGICTHSTVQQPPSLPSLTITSSLSFCLSYYCDGRQRGAGPCHALTQARKQILYVYNTCTI